MKSHLFLIVLFYGLNLSAQNWKPVQSGDEYLYSLQGHTFDSTMVELIPDSVDVTGNDTTIYLRRHLEWAGGSLYEFKENFLGIGLTYHSDGTWYCFGTQFRAVVLPNQPVATPWLFDTLHNVTATITSKILQNVLGNQDSVSTINLSTGDSIKLSKNYGIVNWDVDSASYTLAGINGRGIGIQINMLTLFYTLQPGDIQEYLIVTTSYFTQSPFNNNTTYTRAVDSLLSKSIAPNGTISLNYTRTYHDSIVWQTSPVTMDSGTISITRTIATNISNLNSQFSNNINTHFWRNTPAWDGPAFENRVYYDTSGMFQCRTVVYDPDLTDPALYNGGDFITFAPYIYTGGTVYRFRQILGDSVGIIYSSMANSYSGGYSYSKSETLVYAKIGTEVFGTPDLYISIAEEPVINAVTVFPNPTRELLQCPPQFANTAIALYGVAGDILSTSITNSAAVLDVSALAAGIYIIDFGNGAHAKFLKE